MKKNLIKNTPNNTLATLHKCRLLVIPLAVATVTLCISPDAFAEKRRFSIKVNREQVKMVAGFARLGGIEGERTFIYGAKILKFWPIAGNLENSFNRKPPVIKSIAGIPVSEDDCTIMDEVREMANGRKVTETTQKCVRTDIPAEDLDFYQVGSSVAIEFSVANDAPVTGANFLQVIN